LLRFAKVPEIRKYRLGAGEPREGRT